MDGPSGRPPRSATPGPGFCLRSGLSKPCSTATRTGQGQFVRTSILYAHLLNASTAWTSPDGALTGCRQKPDADLYGWCALYRLYETLDGWLCIAVLDDPAWQNLCTAVGRWDLASDSRFATAAVRLVNDDLLVAELTTAFSTRTAQDWFTSLDAAGVPCEICDPTFPATLFDDPAAAEIGLVSRFEHPKLGKMRVGGLYFDLSDTPGTAGRPALIPGQDSRSILAELGYSEGEIDKLIADEVVGETAVQPVS
jgi:crotonobetainyl-CoA:carnitine CoA-transferase CaiB-like acyl-CoA transferase